VTICSSRCCPSSINVARALRGRELVTDSLRHQPEFKRALLTKPVTTDGVNVALFAYDGTPLTERETSPENPFTAATETV
jgi:hypothetical protein